MMVSSEQPAAVKQKEPSPLLPLLRKPEQRFALAAFLMGFVFWRWLMIVMAFGFQGLGVTVFALLYVAAVSLYFHRAGIRQNREAKQWLAVVLATALSFAVWSAPSISPWRFIFLFAAATYWVVVASGNTIADGTSDWSVRDFLGGVIAVPMGGLGLQYRALYSMRKPGFSVSGRFWSAIVGLGLGLLVVAVVSPLLLAADAGGFRVIGQWLSRFTIDLQIPGVVWVQLVLSVPTAAYIFALVVGNVHRGTERREAALCAAETSNLHFSFLPSATTTALLTVVNALYLVFILAQLPYLFSAFAGRMPAGWVSYAGFARQGFFELCVIAVLNLGVILGVHFSAEKSATQSKFLQGLLILLPALTLVLVATAFSKLWLYVDQFGLTMMRIKPGAVLLLLTVIFGCLLLGDKAKFSKLRVTVATGVIIMLAFSWLNVEGFVADYNARRYLDGTLPHFDVSVLHAADVAGAPVAIQLLGESDDIGLQAELRDFVNVVRARDAMMLAERRNEVGWGGWIETWQRRQARSHIAGVAPQVSLEEVVAWVNRSGGVVNNLPLRSLTIGDRLLWVQHVHFPYVALVQHGEVRGEDELWIVDLRDGETVVGGSELQDALRQGWERFAPADAPWNNTATSLEAFHSLRLFGVSPDGRKLGLYLVGMPAFSPGPGIVGMGLVGFIDLAANTVEFTGMAHSRHYRHDAMLAPRWSPTGRYIYYYGDQGYVFDPETGATVMLDAYSTLSVDCIISRERVLHLSSAAFSGMLFPQQPESAHFEPWLRGIEWADGDELMHFITVALPGVDEQRFQMAVEGERVRQELGEALWTADIEARTLHLRSVYRPD